MSLDVYLEAPSPPIQPNGGSGIFLRRNGQTVEITREEWDQHFPGQEPVVITAEFDLDTNVYSANITHNLGKMADAAGIYDALWRPDEHGLTHARQLIEPMEAGLKRLTEEPDKFRALNPSNGWGSYGGLIQFVTDYLKACKQYPDATVRVSR